jgi:hypothetical protein
MPYANKEYYRNQYYGTELDDGIVEKYLKLASNDIDALTFNRIRDVEFDNLTDFQQNTIKDVICRLAEFKFLNKELLDNFLSSYSINGVTMNFEKSWNVKIIGEVVIPKNLYSLLEQTGLTCRNFRW